MEDAAAARDLKEQLVELRACLGGLHHLVQSAMRIVQHIEEETAAVLLPQESLETSPLWLNNSSPIRQDSPPPPPTNLVSNKRSITTMDSLPYPEPEASPPPLGVEVSMHLSPLDSLPRPTKKLRSQRADNNRNFICRSSLLVYSFFMTLPDEIILHIAEYLDVRSLCMLSLVNSHIRSLADTTPWEQVFARNLGASWLVRDHGYQNRGLHYWKDHVVDACRLARCWEHGGTQTTLAGHTKPIKTLQFVNNRLITGDEMILKEWDLESMKLRESFSSNLNHQKCLTFRFDDQKLLISTLDTVRAYDLQQKALLFSLPDILSPIMSLRFDQQKIITGAWNGAIAAWSTVDGHPLAEISGHNNPIYCLDTTSSSCGWHLLVTGSSDKWLKLWDINTTTSLQTLRGHTKTVQSVQFDSHLVISSSRDSTIRVWDIRLPTPLIGTLKEHTDDATCVRFDATRIVSGSADRTIKVWDMRTLRCMYNLMGHAAGITCLEFSKSLIVSGSEDGGVKVWRFDG